MAKNIVQDVVRKGNRRSIRDITLPGKMKDESSEKIVVHDETVYENPSEEGTKAQYFHREEDVVEWAPEKNNKSKLIVWLLGIAAVFVLIIAISNLFYSSTITLTPKSQNLTLNINLTAKLKAPAGEISYKSISLVKEKEVVVQSDGERKVEARATGKIIIYNNFSTASQRLVKNTRFETPNGLIYKISDSVTIPGKTTAGGKVSPGSVEATVFAESVGAEYNIGLTDFTIPGFKSSLDRYKNFYARSKTPMIGGKVGMEKSLSDEKMKETKAKLESDIISELTTETKKALAPEYLFYDKSYRVVFETVSVTPDTNKNTVTIKERAKWNAYIINRSDLTAAIAKNYLDGYDNLPVEIVNTEELNFIFRNKEEFSVVSTNPIDFGLKGEAKIVWTIDKTKFAASLAGKKKSELPSVAVSEPSIFKAEAVIRPFWKSSFPAKVQKIKINILDPYAKEV